MLPKRAFILFTLLLLLSLAFSSVPLVGAQTEDAELIGTIAVGDAVSGSMESGKTIAYSFTAAANQVITVVEEPQYPDLYVVDAAGTRLEPTDWMPFGRVRKSVFEFPASGDYRITFSTMRTGALNYTFSVAEGDTLHPNIGMLQIGDTVTDTIPDEYSRLRRTFEVQPGQTITLAFTGPLTNIILTDANDDYFLPLASSLLYTDPQATNAELAEVFSIPDTAQAPFTLETWGRGGTYTLTVSEGDTVRVFRDSLHLGDSIDDKVTEQSKAIMYPLEIEPGTVIRVAYTSPTFTAPPGETYTSRFLGVYDEDGTFIRPIEDTTIYDEATSSLIYYWVIPDAAPYYFFRTGTPEDYTLTVTQFDASEPMIIEDHSPSPTYLQTETIYSGVGTAERPSNQYTGTVKEGQLLLFELSQGTFTLTNPSGEVIYPLASGVIDGHQWIAYQFRDYNATNPNTIPFNVDVGARGVFMLTQWNENDAARRALNIASLETGTILSGTLRRDGDFSQVIEYPLFREDWETFTIISHQDINNMNLVLFQLIPSQPPDPNYVGNRLTTLVANPTTSTYYTVMNLPINYPHHSLRVGGSGLAGDFALEFVEGDIVHVEGEPLSEGVPIIGSVDEPDKIVMHQVTFPVGEQFTMMMSISSSECGGGTSVFDSDPSSFGIFTSQYAPQQDLFSSRITFSFDTESCTYAAVYPAPLTEFAITRKGLNGWEPGTYRIALFNGDQSENLLAIKAFALGAAFTPSDAPAESGIEVDTSAETNAENSAPAESSTEGDAPAESGASVVCSVSTGANSNIRSQPSTSSSVAGTLAAGTSADASGQATGADGIVWWQLASGGWVRSDIVNETGDCTALPTINP